MPCTSNPCRNGSTCQNGYNGRYYCYCPSGYTGSQCETAANVSCSCLNGGTCRYTWYSGYRCDCPNGYTGRTCETNLNACSSNPCLNGATCHNGYGRYRCSCPSGYIGQQCQTDMSDTVRIQGGGSSGQLQVLHNGVWGTVCDDLWSMNNTHVVCRQLGFPGGLSYANMIGTGQIWLDDVQCSGSESAIQQCRHRGWGRHDCGHSEDVFVTCYPIECSNYTVLNTADRAASYKGITNKCDMYDITKGWYRFMGDAGTAIATSCVEEYHCGTSYPGWMQGSHPSQVEGIVTRRVCYSRSVPHCCNWSNNIRVRNCGGFYVYELVKPTAGCDLRYCSSGTNNTCMSSPCRNNGTCATTYSGYRCYCPYGYSGKQCETNMYPCTSSPCRNGGNCYNNGYYGRYYCSCRYGYTGQQCQFDMPCNRNPCRNGGTCHNDYYSMNYTCSCPSGYTGSQCETAANASCSCLNGGTCRYTWYSGYRCYCPNGYTGRTCETSLYACNSNPCRNGGTCRGGYGWYICSCPSELTGQQCESNLNTNVTCGENYMQIDLEDSYFSEIDWRNLHLKDPSCRATKTADTKRLRAPLNRCGTTYTETQKTITFWNEVKADKRYQPVGNGTGISRDRHLLLRFFCAYERSRFVSTSFLPSKKTVVASEGSYGNFTFTMDLYQSSSYSTPYSPFAYPVVVHPNQPLWVQYEVKNTNADLVVFAENCRATPSNDPNATPQHVLLQRGCVRDQTMVYWYNPYSKVQRFSIRSFRFVYSNSFLVYLHCELLVCHRNSNSSRCAQGCISGSRRRRETADMDGSKAYDLSAGPLKGDKINAKSNNQEGSLMSKQLIGGLGAVGGVFFVITILLSVIVYRNRRRGQDNKPTSIALDVTVNSYEQDNVDSDEKDDIEL